MSVHFRVFEEHLLIVGHTYPHKEQIKQLGATFDRRDKVWKVANTPDNFSSVERLCTDLGGGLIGASRAPRQSPAPRPPDPVANGLSIAEVLSKCDLAVRSCFPQSIWVIAEVQGLVQRASGWYLQLSEGKAKGSGTLSINATLWNSTLAHLKSRPGFQEIMDVFEDGLRVRVHCQVNLYRDRGQLSLNILDIDASFTKGALALAREQLLKELRQKGLDTANKRLSLPYFPFSVGLISAEKSRAKSDFLDQLKSYNFPGKVTFVDARMQGESTSGEVAAGIQALQSKNVDLIVITRGGGSVSDLRWFDEKKVALAIAYAKVPVLAAIGHHDDSSVAEEIAFRREKTPTAAADFILDVFRKADQRIRDVAKMLSSRADGKLQDAMMNMQSLEKMLLRLGEIRLTSAFSELTLNRERLISSAGLLLAKKEREFSQKENQFFAALQEAFASHCRRLETLKTALIGKDPRPWLKKGWTKLTLKGVPINSVAQLHEHAKLEATLLDGSVLLDTINIKKRSPN